MSAVTLPFAIVTDDAFAELGTTSVQFGRVLVLFWAWKLRTVPSPVAMMHATFPGSNDWSWAWACALIVTVGRKALASDVLCCNVSVT